MHILNPENSDIEKWLNSEDKIPYTENWISSVCNGSNDNLIIKYANDSSCKDQMFFIHCLYHMVGNYLLWFNSFDEMKKRIFILLSKVNNNSDKLVQKWKNECITLFSGKVKFDKYYWASHLHFTTDKSKLTYDSNVNDSVFVTDYEKYLVSHLKNNEIQEIEINHSEWEVNVYEPENIDVINWVESGSTKWYAADWDYYVCNGKNDILILNYANNLDCKQQDFFIHCLYLLMGIYILKNCDSVELRRRIIILLDLVTINSSEPVKRWKQECLALVSGQLPFDKNHWTDYLIYMSDKTFFNADQTINGEQFLLEYATFYKEL